MLTQKDIRNHYKNPSVMSTIMRVSRDDDSGSLRAGNLDFMHWYKHVNGKELKLNLNSRVDYGNMLSKGRVFYWTLNYFDPEIFSVDYSTVNSVESPKISRKYTAAYTFGIDIDKEHGKDIHDPVIKKSVEALAQYFTDKLREYAPNSVYVLYSGGGIYVLVHHRVFDKYYSSHNDDWDSAFAALGNAFDLLIGDMRDEFFKLCPEHVGNVKPDQLNNSQRVFKTIFSLHKSLDYAVIPLNPACIEIDFERATLPLKNEVLKEGENWYTKYDEGTAFIDNLLKPYLEKATAAHKSKTPRAYSCSPVPLEDINSWAPCMRNIYNLPTCGEGATRALADFVSYLGQIGIEKDAAYAMFMELVTRWGARASNIFEGYYKKMQVPTCDKLLSTSNIGFPKGVSIRNLGVCKPDLKCQRIPTPYLYTDTAANQKRLLSHLNTVTQLNAVIQRNSDKIESTQDCRCKSPQKAECTVSLPSQCMNNTSEVKRTTTSSEVVEKRLDLRKVQRLLMEFDKKSTTQTHSAVLYSYYFIQVYPEYAKQRTELIQIIKALLLRRKIKKCTYENSIKLAYNQADVHAFPRHTCLEHNKQRLALCKLALKLSSDGKIKPFWNCMPEEFWNSIVEKVCKRAAEIEQLGREEKSVSPVQMQFNRAFLGGIQQQKSAAELAKEAFL